MVTNFNEKSMKYNSGFLFDLILYISFLFILYHLYSTDFLKFPKVHNLDFFLASLIFLVIFSFLDSITWYKVLDSNGFQIDIRDSISSIGLPIFARYIPGKIFMILGPAAYVTKNYKYS